jgi:hypothetical protein
MWTRWTVTALLCLLSAGPAVASQPSLQPLVAGWEQHFTLAWQVSQSRGRPVLEGYIRNESGFAALRVRLLVESLDASGRPVEQRVEWLGTGLTPGHRVFFEVPAPPRSATYRVSVFSYDWVQAAQQTP